MGSRTRPSGSSEGPQNSRCKVIDPNLNILKIGRFLCEGGREVSAQVVDPRRKQEVQKRLTLNTLSQGAAVHAMLSIHHLASAELNQIDPRLVTLYSQFAAGACLTYYGEGNGGGFQTSDRFWQGIPADHPYSQHPILARHGLALQQGAKAHLEGRLARLPRGNPHAAFGQIAQIEHQHREELQQLAIRLTSEVWHIPPDRLIARLGQGQVDPETPWDDESGLAGMSTGMEQVVMRPGPNGTQKWCVDAVGAIFPILCQELCKGVCDLLGRHQINGKTPEEKQGIIADADKMSLEPSQINVGPELWRKLLAVAPNGLQPDDMMHKLSTLPPHQLHTLLDLAIRSPEQAKQSMSTLFSNPEEE